MKKKKITGPSLLHSQTTITKKKTKKKKKNKKKKKKKKKRGPLISLSLKEIKYSFEG